MQSVPAAVLVATSSDRRCVRVLWRWNATRISQSLDDLHMTSCASMADYHRPDAKTLQTLKDLANKLRIDSIRATNASNSG